MNDLGIDAYSYHRFFGEIHDTQVDPRVRWDTFQLLDHLRQFDVDGVLIDTFLMPDWDRTLLRQVRRTLDDAGLKRALAWGHPSGLNAGRSPEAEADLRRHVEATGELETDILRIVGGSWRTAAEEPHAVQIERLANQLGELTAFAGSHGVRLAIENHWDFTADEMLSLLAKVGEANPLYVTFDTGNALRVGDDPVEAARKLAPRTILVHLKDIGLPLEPTEDRRRKTPCVPIGTGIIDIPGVYRAMADAGFAGLWAIEIDSPRTDLPDEDAIIARSLEYLRNLQPA